MQLVILLCMYLINAVVAPLCRPTYCTASMQRWTWEDVYLQSTGMYYMYLYLPALGSL